ncbi:hypothetical protein KHS38_04160 [Mucilaginibacter sp. Bleaf8]|uniref:hypothetical protein n=1 Tax=Mucilaginibacter sp. Bleaf8 TaxID=2834430 RepID=UPI001BCC59F5|nr:hypothetical protein [Mucilaginibacter sp. Bleaf8]MBS7563592.1 hypothetical protein [Mucilaginibacter sp. Bleaf8]
MTDELQQIQQALKNIVLTYIEAQKINTEPVYNSRIYGAETNIRVIANKRVPYLMYDIMKQLHVLDDIEFEQPEASVHYVIQIISSITSFEKIWEQCLVKWGSYSRIQVALQNLFDLDSEIRTEFETLHLNND